MVVYQQPLTISGLGASIHWLCWIQISPEPGRTMISRLNLSNFQDDLAMTCWAKTLSIHPVPWLHTQYVFLKRSFGIKRLRNLLMLTMPQKSGSLTPLNLCKASTKYVTTWCCSAWLQRRQTHSRWHWPKEPHNEALGGYYSCKEHDLQHCQSSKPISETVIWPDCILHNPSLEDFILPSDKCSLLP